MSQLTNPKLFSMREAHALRNQWRQERKTVVFTNGCFDILHAGHVYYLAEAKKLGDILVIGLNSDRSMKKLKKRSVPLQNEADRAYVLAGLESVDCIVYFHEETPFDIVNDLLPDILVKGGDYTRNTIVGADTVENHGGKVITIPLLSGRSTTKIARRMKKWSENIPGESS